MENPYNAKVEVNKLMCIICQKRKRLDELSEVKESGKKKLISAAQERKKLLDANNSLAILRILKSLDASANADVFRYHRTCYAVFTNVNMINRLQKISDDTGKKVDNNHTAVQSGLKVTRSTTGTLDWGKCLICQDSSKKEHSRQVMSNSMNERLLRATALDFMLHARVGGITDFIAKSAVYHSTCVLKLECRKKKLEQDPSESDLPFIQLCKEVRVAGSLGKTLQLSDVWDRYENLAASLNKPIPSSLATRRSNFREKLEAAVGDIFQFFQPLDREISERQTLLICKKKSVKQAASNFLNEESHDDEFQLPSYKSADENFLDIVHAALSIRADLRSCPGHSGLNVSSSEAASVVPKSLYLFLQILLGGEKSLNEMEESIDDDDDEDLETRDDDEPNDEKKSENQVCLSIGQDIFYAVNKNRKLTPKHIGLGLALHQSTRSKKLITLFHRAGHCISYKQVLQADTSLAKESLQSMDKITGAITPPNFKSHGSTDNSILHITADNIDIMTDTLDGKNTFHATQMVAFQRGAIDTSEILGSIKIGSDTSLKIPSSLTEIFPTAHSKSEPNFHSSVQLEWYKSSCGTEIDDNSQIEDVAFAMSRLHDKGNEGWTEFRKKLSKKDFKESAIGYMPLILDPAHEISTLNTVLKRSLAVADSLGERYVVVTTDQALYCKLIELQWNSPEYRSRVILRMGGLHIALNFLKVIGQHMNGTGLTEIWLEGGIMGEGSIARVMEGKAYAKGMRAHKLTFQALWRLIRPQFESYLKTEYPELAKDFDIAKKDFVTLQPFLKSDSLKERLNHFVGIKSENSPNFALWWTYVDLVLILLMFTKSIRDGIWLSYRAALTEMLPYMARYDHGNYFKSMSIYIADMNQLPEEVEKLFNMGDFAVQRSKNKFSQVDPDHAQEWVVGIGKDTGGLTGITQNVEALQRWALSYHWRSEVSRKTFEMYGISSIVQFNEGTKARKLRDDADENSIMKYMESFGLFAPDTKICNIATKDQATDEIAKALLDAKSQGQLLVNEFVTQRLCYQDSTKPPVSFSSPVPKNNALTMADLYKVRSKKDPQNIIQADRDVLRRLVVSYEAGRAIDLRPILKHELLPVPLSLAQMNGALRATDKSLLQKILLEKIECPPFIELEKKNSHLIIDGQAVVQALGKPANATTFGDLAEHFINKIKTVSLPYKRVDVLFDRYREVSVKSGTRKKRTKGAAPIRRVIESNNVPLPKNWKNFMDLSDNKANLACFLSNQLLLHDFGEVEVVVSGGFEDETTVKSTKPETNIDRLSATHEEADTRVILHAVNSSASNITVMARDTDIFVLLIHHFSKIGASKIWLMAGTAKERKYIPIHSVCQNLSKDQAENMIAFHTITGCDTTSQLATITKRTAWKHYKGSCSLLAGLGKSPLHENVIASVEKFVVQLYKVDAKIEKADDARYALFGLAKKPEALPPTSDSLKLHILRSHYQTFVWENADQPNPMVPDPKTCGWRTHNEELVPLWMTIDPIPKACLEILSCGCKTQCGTKMCRCRKALLPCTKICKCGGSCLNAAEGA